MQGQIRTYFEIEARELIDRLTRGAMELSERMQADEGFAPAPAAVQPLQRAAHTLKGAAHVVGEPRLATLAHDFEDALALFTRTPGRGSGLALVALTDALAAELAHAGAAAAEPAAAAVSAPAAAPEPPQPAVERRRRASEQTAPGLAFARTIRVELERTERLLEQVGESTRVAAGLRQGLVRLREGIGAAEYAAGIELRRQQLMDDLDRLDRTLKELYRTSSQLRLISSENLLLEAGRMVRASASALGREVVCVTQGGQERVDIHVLEALEGALLHLVRNAVAHGTEPPDERRAQGKPAVAQVTVSLELRGSELRLLCADDGRGIDPERIRAAAGAQGLLTMGDAAQADRAQLLELLFRPGFSTSVRTDQVSGRGVGLDAVRTTVEALGGQVRIESTPGQGTVFTLTIPQTLAAVPALEIVAGGHGYALPLAAIEQTFLLGVHHTTVSSGALGQSAPGWETLLLGHDTMPVLRLSDAFPAGTRQGRSSRSGGAGRASGVRPRSCVVLISGDARAALAVDALGGICDVLVRPLPAFVGASPAIAGAVLNSAGEPMLLLDAAGLIDLARSRRAPIVPEPAEATETAAIYPILVIDDSLTTRMLEQSILESEGYTVELATSAEQGLEKARAQRYALFLVDVEMPGMSGFDFVRTVQADAELRRTPSILVTSLDSAESRDAGRESGAQSYIVKGEFQQEQYLERVRALAGPPAHPHVGGFALDGSAGAPR